ncbi:phosphoribosylanthranilate isomerase [Parabacteroides sp. PFB2-12]|uniref:phosphoribosylanthranilate isomerase n=1 Tax=unclassified Parabacteroides TaxID=2649774 RepID=UPI002476CAF0|nr:MULTISPECIES: phosphoribosylanthranilate isomerase [unclassified Parabacteroides]MDH6343920.1 phosphoribosylanthranilate isomerase [Parabacteroides sp. PM6-13]MDH6391719.1 phosphoribosylanthranilate isomerase [Parabacteroides sp. PFB2-12]
MIIKVCGMTDPENIRAVAALNIHWMGFIFYKKSPRYLSEVPVLPTSLAGKEPKRVGVFVNPSLQEIRERVAAFRLDYVQLHGNESAAFCRHLQELGIAVIKAFSIETADDLQQTAVYEDHADYFLFDTKSKYYGGSGKQFDWSLLAHYKGATPFLLSGGIGPEDTEHIQRFHHPAWAGIDLNSGFETAPGLKEPHKLNKFIQSIQTNKNK